ncbi:MAG TPA: hypothetical protein DCG12_07035 [Planctomycetaceae bacterium]|nr:hypothetical protein [Planctomycetaceae bacterium]
MLQSKEGSRDGSQTASGPAYRRQGTIIGGSERKFRIDSDGVRESNSMVAKSRISTAHGAVNPAFWS